MAKYRICLFLPPLFLVLALLPASAQERFYHQPGAARLPTADEVLRAQVRAREAMDRVPQEGSQQQLARPSMPNVRALPNPAAAAPDITTLAEKYKDLGRAALPRDRTPDLLVMVSFAMPKETLERIADQAERAGATLVFRGLKGESMTKMGEEVQKILRGRNVSVAIHPPAFQQFSVTRVPAVVIARPEAGHVLENGCSRVETFVKVSGDVSLDYALDYIERKSPTWAAVAKEYRGRIVRGIN
jgi:conjugal transfer pilus assembly protein TrbC